MSKTSETQSTWSHPLIRRPDRGLSRRYLIGLSGGAIAGLALVPGRSEILAQSASPDVEEADISGDDDAVTLLTSAVQAMSGLETFHFLIETTSGATQILDVLEIDTIEGDVRRPFDFQTTVSAEILMGKIEVTAVGIDGRVQIEDPTSTSGGWIDLGTDPQTLSLLNPDYLFLQAVRIVQDARIDGEEEFEGEDTRRVTGTVSFADITRDFIGEEGPLPAELSPDPIELNVWIDGDNLIRGVELVGPVLASESTDVIRLITFSAFNEPVNIQTPGA